MSSSDSHPGAPERFADWDLPVPLVHALRRAGVDHPTDIQRALFDASLAGEHIAAQSPTGSGKTLAFAVPVLQRLQGKPARPGKPRCLIIAPTRELANQLDAVMGEPAAAVGIRVAAVVGGDSFAQQQRRLAAPVDVLIGTPGRLTELLHKQVISFTDVLVSVVDEADQLAAVGFVEPVAKLLKACKRSTQRIFVSATLDRAATTLIKACAVTPRRFAVQSDAPSPEAVGHHLVEVVDDLDKAVVRISHRDGATLFFAATQQEANRLAELIRDSGQPVEALHGKRGQATRTRLLAEFAEGTLRTLVATDVAARGVDIADLDLVVQVGLPHGASEYIHRAGRTGRAGRAGMAVMLVGSPQLPTAEAVFADAGIEPQRHELSAGSYALSDLTGAKTPPPVKKKDPSKPSSGGGTSRFRGPRHVNKDGSRIHRKKPKRR